MSQPVPKPRHVKDPVFAFNPVMSEALAKAYWQKLIKTQGGNSDKIRKEKTQTQSDD